MIARGGLIRGSPRLQLMILCSPYGVPTRGVEHSLFWHLLVILGRSVHCLLRFLCVVGEESRKGARKKGVGPFEVPLMDPSGGGAVVGTGMHRGRVLCLTRPIGRPGELGNYASKSVNETVLCLLEM